MVQQQDIDHVKGDTKVMVATFTDDADVAIDITGATIHLTVKNEYSDADPGIFQKVVTVHTNPTLGISTVTVDPADTNAVTVKTYKYDLQLLEASGKKSTIIRGKWNLLEQATIT